MKWSVFYSFLVREVLILWEKCLQRLIANKSIHDKCLENKALRSLAKLARPLCKRNKKERRIQTSTMPMKKFSDPGSLKRCPTEGCKLDVDANADKNDVTIGVDQ